MKSKRIILLFFLFLWMAMIFAFSHQKGEQSQNLSDSFTIKIIEKIKHKELKENEKIEYAQKLSRVVRKTAHFFVYFVLGILFFLLLENAKRKHVIMESVILSFLYACTDEFHQLFVVNRTGRILDIMIDTIGAFLGIVLIFNLYRFYKKKKEVESYEKKR